jgi:hypothetical protein
MQVTTTRRDGSRVNPGHKPFSWSYSRLKNFEACPKKHWHVDIAKDAKEEESEQLTYGNAVHKAAAKRLKDKTPLPPGMSQILEPWCERIEQGTADGCTILVEQQLAIAADFGPCGWFEKGERAAWYRGVADVIKLVWPPMGSGPGVAPSVALAVDWKTGKIIEDSVQLALMAQCVFAHYPTIQKIRTEFVWLKEDATTRADFARADMPGLWRSILPRVEVMKAAHESMNYPPKPGGLCKRWCPVTQCPHCGVG